MTDRQTWLIYARTHAEFQVVDDLTLMGADAWAGRVLEGKPDPKRAGRKRVMIWTERPAIPNYVFATLTDAQYHDATALKEIVGWVSVVSPAALRGVERFRRDCEQAYRAAQRARERGEQAPPQFRPGQALEAISGPLSGLMLRYRAIIEDTDGYSVECETDLGRVKVNPADVRATG